MGSVTSSPDEPSGASGRPDPTSDTSDTWTGVQHLALDTATMTQWLPRRSCGAVVTFVGTARDHSVGRPGVTDLEFEVYESAAERRLAGLGDELRRRFPGVARLVLVHRSGLVPLGEAAVFVGVSAPHRDEAFDAARFGIDALKATVPIWKRETWDGGDSSGTDAQHLVSAAEFEPERGQLSNHGGT